MIARIALATALVVTGISAAPAGAQRRQHYVEVFGTDKCPKGNNDEIIVCGRLPESDRYRIPTEFREAAPTDSVTQSSRIDEMVAIGRTGTDSCSPVGPGGFTGCFQQQVNANRAEKKQIRRRRLEEPR